MSLSTGNETMSSLLSVQEMEYTHSSVHPAVNNSITFGLKHSFAGVCVQESCQNAYQVGMLPDTTK